jgi:hypothetical protein
MSEDEEDGFPSLIQRRTTDLSAQKKGWAKKCGGVVRNWKRRWFVIRGLMLHYYVNEGGLQKGTVELPDARRIERAPECKFQPALKIEMPKRTYYMVCDTMEEVDEWIEAMNMACSPSYLG